MDFDYNAGGEYDGAYYPALKPLSEAIRRESPSLCQFFIYEPGNGTRYDVLISTFNTGYSVQHNVSIVNMGRSMMFSGPFSMVALSYMKEKLNLNYGDCYALIPLINAYLEGFDHE